MLRTKLAAAAMLITGSLAQAQDVQGIELCTHETNMARRTGCLQSNIDYLQRLIAKNAATAQRRLDAANAEIAALKAALANLQARVSELQAASAGKPSDK